MSKKFMVKSMIEDMGEESRKASDMGKLYFVRHGQTVWNVENKICGASESPLTELGHEQARETGRALKQRIDAGELAIDEILASPLRRAYDTAREISDITGISMRTEPRLSEQNSEGGKERQETERTSPGRNRISLTASAAESP